ncbi:MAG TPA: hypothetical protein VGH79_08865 [Gaiellaceae bacterium]|jgi:hypothetical protein
MRRPNGRMLLGGAARLGVFAVIAGAFACAGGVLLGAVLHEGARRGIAIGLYLTGSALAGFGFLLGSRPPVRGRGADAGFFSAFTGQFKGAGGVRWATRDEHQQAMNLPAILLTVGVGLLLVGVSVDTRH